MSRQLILHAASSHTGFYIAPSNRLATAREVDVNEDEWIQILKLAVRWRFQSIKNKAIRRLHVLDIIPRVELGRQYGIRQWLQSAFEELVSSWDPIAAMTGECLGWPTYLSLVNMREKVWQYRIDNGIQRVSSSTCPPPEISCLY